MTKKLVIFLHGVGSSGADLAVLGQLWQERLPDTHFSAPNAPQAFGQGGGWQWFSLNGITEANRPQRIIEARAEFDQTIQAICQQQGVDPSQDKLVFVGFSQGSIMALDALVSGRWPLAAVVAFSGRLATLQGKPGKAVPTLLVHGQRDPVIPWQESQQAQEKLQALGIPVQVSWDATAGHTITQQGAENAGEFLKKHLA
ncbi:alpha/beta hydrolase [Mangrovibacter yixingensis]|uniref:alpha/beta hydrolase n=1 Tax=Mangrovibacter yixingensis TaxID=1529639 RepID=UPI001CFF1BE5|nr:dienelactone hydrolase family protein [Mangrovibacter yixingensis]